MENDLKTITILFRAVDSITELIKKDMKNHKLNVTEFGTLEVLYHKGTLPVQQIIDKVLVANSSMSYVLSKLVQKGLVSKEYCPTDKRSYHVSITKKGQELMDKIYPMHLKTLRNVLDILSKDEEKQLQMHLKKIGKNT